MKAKKFLKKSWERQEKNYLIPLLNVDSGIAADVVQDLSDVRIFNTRTEDKNAKHHFAEHVKSTIKKDNVDYLPIIKTANSSSNEAIASFSAELPTLTEIIRNN